MVRRPFHVNTEFMEMTEHWHVLLMFFCLFQSWKKRLFRQVKPFALSRTASSPLPSVAEKAALISTPQHQVSHWTFAPALGCCASGDNAPPVSLVTFSICSLAKKESHCLWWDQFWKKLAPHPSIHATTETGLRSKGSYLHSHGPEARKPSALRRRPCLEDKIKCCVFVCVAVLIN